jgi:hypothetical protein
MHVSTVEDWAPDGVVAPDETRSVVVRHFRALLGSAPSATAGPLATWPVAL